MTYSRNNLRVFGKYASIALQPKCFDASICFPIVISMYLTSNALFCFENSNLLSYTL